MFNFHLFLTYYKMLSILPPGMSDSSDEELSDQAECDILSRPTTDETVVKSEVQDDGNSVGTPRGVSQDQWKKFLQLQKNREELPSSLEVNVRPRKRRRHPRKRKSDKGNSKECGSSNKRDGDHGSLSKPLIGPQFPAQPSKYPGQPAEQEWKEIKEYLGVHDRFKGVNYGKESDKSGLEKEIDSAIKAKNFQTAEKLSDRLANRDFGTKIHQAIKAKEYVENQEKEKVEKSKKKKRQKLAWRFEAKERWEMKGNM